MKDLYKTRVSRILPTSGLKPTGQQSHRSNPLLLLTGSGAPVLTIV